jgi:hypothetical protein
LLVASSMKSCLTSGLQFIDPTSLNKVATCLVMMCVSDAREVSNSIHEASNYEASPVRPLPGQPEAAIAGEFNLNDATNEYHAQIYDDYPDEDQPIVSTTFQVQPASMDYGHEDGMLPLDHLLLDRSPNIGPQISLWELDKFKNCRNKSFRTSKILALLYLQFSNLLVSQRDIISPRLGALYN